MLSPREIAAKTVRLFPQIWPYLSQRAKWLAARPVPYRSYDYFWRTLTHMIQMVYDGFMAGEFQDILANLIHGQLSDAFERALLDQNLAFDEAPGSIRDELQSMILAEYEFITPLYREIVDARVDGQPVEPLLSRADIWANRWNDAYNRATELIAIELGQRLVWRLGQTEKHCSTCSALNGIVAFAAEWEQSGFRPQSPPNDMLECGGWRCDCNLEVTTQRRSPRALDTLLDLAAGGGL